MKRTAMMRLLALALCVGMLVSLFSVGAFAQEQTDAVNLLETVIAPVEESPVPEEAPAEELMPAEPVILPELPAEEGLPMEEAPAEEASVEEEAPVLDGEGSVELSAANFPDANFRAYLSDRFDWDGDGWLSEEEQGEIYNIDCCGMEISSLEGIQLLPVGWLECWGNNLTELDVSGMTSLEYLCCDDNPLTTLKVDGCTSLWHLAAQRCQITALDVSGCPNMKELNFPDNQIATMDLSGCPKLTYVNFERNGLTAIDITGCTKIEDLYLMDNDLRALDLSGCEASLTGFTYGGNTALTDLDISGLVNLTVLDCRNLELGTLDVSVYPELYMLACYNCGLTELDLSRNPKLEVLYCSDNALTELDLSRNPKLVTLECSENQLSELEVGHLSLRRLVCHGNNNIPELDISGSKLLCDACDTLTPEIIGVDGVSNVVWYSGYVNGRYVMFTYDSGAVINAEFVLPEGAIVIDETTFPDETFRAYVMDNVHGTADGILTKAEIADITELSVYMPVESIAGVEYLTALKTLEVCEGSISSLNISALTELSFLNVSGGSFGTLDLTANKNLKKVLLSDCELTALKLPAGIEDLGLCNIPLGTLDVSGFPELRALGCETCGLTSLDVSHNPKLEELTCSDNDIRSLDLSNNGSLQMLQCVYTGITELDISACAGLISLMETGERFEEGEAIFWLSEEGVLAVDADVTLIAESADPVAINKTNFPDANFRAYVMAEFDTDGDGALSPAELRAVMSIDLWEADVADLTGVEYFTELTSLSCIGAEGSNKVLTSVDVSQNTKLETLDLEYNAITEIDLSNNTALETLYLDENALTALDVTMLPALNALGFSGNSVAEIDLSGNPELATLFAYENPLAELDLSANTKITRVYAQYTDITALDVSGCPDMVALLTTATVTTAPHATMHPDVKVTSYVAQGQFLSTVKVNEGVKVVYTMGVELTAANFPDPNFLAVVTAFDADENGWLGELELAAVTEIACGSKEITDLTGLEHFTALKTLDCSWNTLENGLDVSANTALEVLNCSVCGLGALDVSALTALQELRCYGNDNIGELDLSHNTALETLFCGDVAITELDVSQNTALKLLNIVNTPLTELDLSHNTELEELISGNNDFTTLDLSANTKLVELWSYGEKLSTLDISACAALERIYINGSPNLTHLDISGCPLLVETLVSGETEIYEEENITCHYIGGNIDVYGDWDYAIQMDSTLILITGLDLTGDGIMALEDAELLIAYAAGVYDMEDETLLETADVNTDGSVDARDATQIVRYTYGLTSVLG